MPHIILPGDFTKAVTLKKATGRDQLIEKFLKNWLTEKQYETCMPWYKEMLKDFSTDLLLQAKKVGIDKLLHEDSESIFQSIMRDLKQDNSYALPLVPPKPTVMQVKMEEIEGDLSSNTKTVPLKTELELDNDVD